MSGSSQPLLDRAYAFPAQTINSYVLLPEFLRGHFVELIVYVLFNHTSDSGKVQIQTAPTPDYAGTWANVGSSIDWAAIDTTKYAAVTGVFGSVRLTLTTAVTTGAASLWVVASAGN